jgi:hypothetical protein
MVRSTRVIASIVLLASLYAHADTVPPPFIQAVVLKAQPACRDAFLVADPSDYQLVEWLAGVAQPPVVFSQASDYQLVEWLAGDVPSVGEVMGGVIWPWVAWVTYADSNRKSKVWVHTLPDSSR